MPIRTSSRCAAATSSEDFPSRVSGRAPGDQPAEVRREPAVDAEVQGAGRVAGGEGGPVPQVDDPLAGLDAAAQLGGVGALGGAQVRGGRAGTVGRSHLRVVGRPGAEPGEQLADIGLLVLREDGVGLLLAADGRRRRLGLGGRAERPEAVGREHLGVVGEQVGQLVGRGVLVSDEVVGVLDPEQVGAAGGAVQQRAAGEDADRGVPVRQGVGQVGERMTGRGQRGQPHPFPDLDGLAVRDRGAVEGDVVGGVHDVRRAGGVGEREPAGHVVVVDVGLEDVGQADTVLVEQRRAPGRCRAAGRPRRRPRRRGRGSCGRPGWGCR